jgi:hypothetical protein
VPTPSLSRRQALQAGAVAALAGVLRPSPTALAAQPGSLFEQSLDFGASARAAAAGGWWTSPVLRAPRRFDLIGLRWARGSHAEAQLRARRRGGKWTRWVTLHPTGDHGPDHGRVPAGTDPAFTGAADEYQLRLRGTPRALHARFVRALPTATLARRLGRRLHRRGARTAKVRRAGSPPAMISRAEWGAAAVPPREAPLFGEVQLAFVHHTVNANDYGPEDSAGIVLGIARFHRNGNGWNDIGYNFLVDKYGQIFEGRAGGIDQAVVGAQAQGWNSVSTGVACIGTFSEVAQTPAGMDALARIIGWKLTVHGIPTSGEITVTSAGGETNRYPAGTPHTFQRISGHRDGNSTSCPGDVLYGQLDDLRVLAAKYAGPTYGLSVYATPEVRGIKAVDVSGSLVFPDASPPGGVAIDVQHKAWDGVAWESLATAVTTPDGSWRTDVTFHRTGPMRAVFAGDSARAALTSSKRHIYVLAKLNLALGRNRLRLGQTFKAQGRASAPAESVKLTLQRRSRRRWVKERRRVLPVSGDAYKVRLRPRTRGKYRVTVQAGRVKRHRQLKVL